MYDHSVEQEHDRLSGRFGRRRFLLDASAGLGAIALHWLLEREARAADREADRRTLPGASPRPAPHFEPKVRRVIQIFACGGMSHLDTFDHKPLLRERHGRAIEVKGKITPFFGQPGTCLQSPWTFEKRGESGLEISSLLPEIAKCADDLTIIRSMVAKSANHTPATFQMNSGFTLNGFPSMGAWLSYGLGTENENLPAYVVLPDPRGLPAGGAINWTSGFLPASHQGVCFRTKGDPIPDLSTPDDVEPAERDAGRAFLARLNRGDLAAHPGDSSLEARIRSYELAARMQTSIPESLDLAREPKSVRDLYGLDQPATAGFGRNCLMARRLIERGVRFVQLYHGGAFGSPRINWDAHEDLKENHGNQAASLDRPVAGLLRDLKSRGLLADTLVLFTTEFGRTPFTQGIDGKGRDHHNLAFSCWMAGAGLRPGIAHGATDEFGYQIVDSPTSIYDLHATILHLLGIDHKRLTYYYNGLNRRLTDVHGVVVEPLLA
ncbi:MAG: DUF1501 domain-containing protein [Isosphaeraceae bacterium]|nr:DUF1501 domain-containing protein [Isosphaeraceae bacterium]